MKIYNFTDFLVAVRKLGEVKSNTDEYKECYKALCDFKNLHPDLWETYDNKMHEEFRASWERSRMGKE